MNLQMAANMPTISFPLIIPKRVWYDFTIWGWHFLSLLPLIFLVANESVDTNSPFHLNLHLAENRIVRNMMYGLSAALIPVVALVLRNSYGKWIKNYSTNNSLGLALGNISLTVYEVSVNGEIFRIEDVLRIKIISNRYQNEFYRELQTQSGITFLQLEMKNGQLKQFNFLIPDGGSFYRLKEILQEWYRMKIPINETHERFNIKTLALEVEYTNEQIAAFKREYDLQ